MSYSLVEQIGKGGMGVVWKARDDETGQIVALKLLRDGHSDDPEYRRRFEHELAIASRITSPHVVKVLGYGEREGQPYIAFELVEGTSLRQMIADYGPSTWPAARTILLQLAEGLADAHAAGVIHRDVKPSNILIDGAGTAKLADFGISRAADLTRMTRASGLMGTPAYLAPEGPLDARSDLYSLGVVAYEMLTGSIPFDGDTYHAVLVGHLSQEPDLSKLPADARPLVGWLLAKAPSARAQTARQLVRVLTGTEAIPAVVSPEPNGASTTKSPGNDFTTLIAPPVGAAVTATPAGSRPEGRKLLPIAAAVGAAIVLAAGALLVASGGLGGRQAASAGPSVVAAASNRPTATPLPTPTPSATPTPAYTYKIPTGSWIGLGSVPGTVWGDGLAELADGHIEVFGAVEGPKRAGLTTTWLIDSNTGAITSGQPMAAPAELPTVLRTHDGMVFALGGWAGNEPIKTAQALDTRTGVWTALPDMTMPRSLASAVELPDGRIMVIGGWASFTSNVWEAGDTVEIYDRTTRKWSGTGSLSAGRALATATMLPDGRVLVTGGSTRWSLTNASASGQTVLATAEVYSGATWKAAGSMSAPRSGHSAALLPNGHVIVAGGWADGLSLGTAGVQDFDPKTGAWTPFASLPSARAQGRLVTLKDGRLMLIAGVDADTNVTAEVDIYDPSLGGWKAVNPLPQAVYWPAATVTADGRVVVAGGATDKAVLGGVEIWAPPST